MHEIIKKAYRTTHLSSHLSEGYCSSLRERESQIAAEMSVLKLYADNISPVCRSVLLLLKKNEIPFEMVEISLKDSEHSHFTE